MRRVCCFCESWTSGGIESFLCNVLTRLDPTQIQVDIVGARLEDSVFTEKLKAKGVQFYELSGSLHKVPENHRRFRALLRENHYDVLHLNAYQGLSLAYLRIAKLEGVPVRIAHSHNTALRKSPARSLKLTVHRWARARYTGDATELWACSKAAADFLFAPKGPKTRGFRFIPNGIDTERFRFQATEREATRRELRLSGKFVIGNVGRLCYQKNQGFLLDVLSELLRRKPETVLLLAGEGEDKPALAAKARRLGIADKVIFCGATDRVERLYWAMDVFAFPSLFEGFGIAAIEAQAAGLPAFCSEQVPEEARITGCMALPLDAELWAERAANAAGRRPAGADAVRKAGFHIQTVAGMIEEAYLKA